MHGRIVIGSLDSGLIGKGNVSCLNAVNRVESLSCVLAFSTQEIQGRYTPKIWMVV